MPRLSPIFSMRRPGFLAMWACNLLISAASSAGERFDPVSYPPKARPGAAVEGTPSSCAALRNATPRSMQLCTDSERCALDQILQLLGKRLDGFENFIINGRHRTWVRRLMWNCQSEQ